MYETPNAIFNFSFDFLTEENKHWNLIMSLNKKDLLKELGEIVGKYYIKNLNINIITDPEDIEKNGVKIGMNAIKKPYNEHA